MSNRTIGFIVLGGAVAWYLWESGQFGGTRYSEQFAPVPPPPPPSAPGFQDWVNGILAAYGQIKDLWMPGGPFYKQPGVPPPPSTWV